ncbi:Alpha-taxilin [Echinococcus granulosus]|uniref:Gamma taxilin n=1 Tax=Echinococcus granulosus TaxID=6210 RepID=A0A068WQQ8_ECHGR|nr:Alpha-taxilin [Echinococcus granulosus]CDS20785.1 gamma taxilin [Echinococcus granulosus]
MATEEPVAEIIEEKQKQEEEKQKSVLGLTKKHRKRELKFIAGELRTLPEDASDEDKLIALYRKFQILNSENSEMSSKLKLTEKRILSVAAERDQYLDSFNRANIQREKLEALCRELQKQNHLIRDQSLAMAQSEDEKRKEVADRFQSGINEIQTQLNDYLEKNNKLREENQMLADKLQKFIADHEKRESYVQKLLKTRELEAKLAEAKAVQARAVQEQAVLREKRETERALEECSLLKQRLEAHQLIEFYKNKYQSFNKTMAKSNDLIENTKKEMQKMTKHLRTAESAALEWRSKWEVSQKALLDMIDECRKEKERSQALQKQVDSLSNLCRALRAGKSSPPKEEEAQPKAEKDADGDENKKGEEKIDEKS